MHELNSAIALVSDAAPGLNDQIDRAIVVLIQSMGADERVHNHDVNLVLLYIVSDSSHGRREHGFAALRLCEHQRAVAT